jgi:hypothetical protein
MGGELERPRQDEVTLEVSTPAWFPATLRAAYTRRWEKRSKEFVEKTAGYVGVTEQAIFDRAETDEAFGDVFIAAGSRVTHTSDAELQDVFARLAAAAFLDDARVDAMSFQLQLVRQLEPVHLRVLRAVDQADGTPEYSRGTDDITRTVNADPGIASAALYRLESLGLVENKAYARGGPPGAGRPLVDVWGTTGLGGELLALTQGNAPPDGR